MLTFNPGPSQITDDVKNDIIEITNSGLLATSHRSSIFTSITENTINKLRSVFNVPKNFKIVFHHSATGAMETILRNLVNKKSGHIVHGAFSERMHKTALQIGLEAESIDVDWGDAVNLNTISFSKDVEMICITHNETSTGLKWPKSALEYVRNLYPEKIITWDMTSSFGGVFVDWDFVDCVFCSVQKCFGLPSGLGILFIDEKVLSLSQEKKIPAWQHLNTMVDMMESYQTVETPNVFGICLLEKQLSRTNLNVITESIKQKYDFVINQTYWKPFISDEQWRSDTVINLEVKNPLKIVNCLKNEGITLGSGYGKLKESCIRIANFPSISLSDLKLLVSKIEQI